MNKMNFAALVAALILAPSLAAADPITATIAAINAYAATSAMAAFIVRIGTSLLLSALASALSSKPGQARQPGIKTEATTAGGSNPQNFLLGKYATAGNMAAVPYSHPNSGDAPNKYLTYVVDVSDAPGVTFSRLSVGGAWVDDWRASGGTHDQEAMIKGGNANLFMTYHDGSQTVADAYMMENYASYPERPWKSDMIGTGVAYAVLTFKYNRELFNALPVVRIEVEGIPLYDPRLDTTVGGSGSQRWDDPATWAQTDNPAVMIYNVLRGITLPDGRRWGGNVPAADLPLASWFAAMNECDQAIDLAAGGTEPQYRAGFEVSLDMEPASVIEELAKSCSGELAEMGGVYKLRVGPPALPVYFFTDDDIVVDQSQRLVPHPGLEGVHNAIHATHPAPDAIWAPKDAPARYNAEWEAADGGRQLVAEVQLPAVYSDTQVQRLMRAWIEDERRFRRHSMTLPPDAGLLEPLDTVSWTSTREGYASKVFEIGDLTDDLTTCLQSISMREREAGDFDWLTSDEIAVEYASTAAIPRTARQVSGFSVAAAEVVDATGTGRIPGVLLSWDGDASDDARGLEYELRLAGGVALASKGFTADAASGELLVTSGVLPASYMEARALLSLDGLAAWSEWLPVTTLAIGVPALPVIAGVTLNASGVNQTVTAAIEISHPDADAVAWFNISLTAPDGSVVVHRGTQVGATSILLDASALGVYLVSITAVGLAGLPGFASETSFTFDNSVIAPANVADFRIRVAGEFATLSWPPAGATVSHYHIRHLPSGVSGGWSQAMDLEAAVYSQGITVPTLAGTYLIRAVSVWGVMSATATAVQTSAAGLASLNVVQAVDPAPVFAGAKSAGVKVVGGFLELRSTATMADWPVLSDLGVLADYGDIEPSGEYQIAAPVDLSEVYTSRVTARVVSYGFTMNGAMDKWPVLADLGVLTMTDPEAADVQLQVRTTLDDPADGGATWSAWADFVIGDYVARGLDFKLLLSTTSPGVAVRVADFVAEIDMPDRVEGGDDVTCPAAGVQVNFAPAFKAKPAISVDGQGLPVGARSVRTNATRTGFHQQFIDDQGAGIVCSFDWVAKGFGRTE